MRLGLRSLALSGAFFLTFSASSVAFAQADCIDTTDACESCADEECPTETQACCDATGCYDLVQCVLQNCSGQADINCVIANCSAEAQAAGGLNGPGTAAAQGLASCLQDPLMNPAPGNCQDCVDSFGGTGGGMATSVGAGGNGTGGGGPGATATVAGAGGSTMTGGGSSATGTGSGTGGANNGGDPLVVENGCGCKVAGVPTDQSLGWGALLGLAGIAVARRKRRS